MKKMIAAILILKMVIIFSACTVGGVKEAQIKTDLQNYFAGSQFAINNIFVELSRNDGDSMVYEVSAMMSAPEAELIRKYRILYSRYGLKKWILEDCSELDKEKWVAKPKKYEVSKERICELLFQPMINGGYRLNAESVKFYNWSEGASGSHDIEEDILNIQHLKEDNGNMKTWVYCGVQSAVIRLNETVEILWEFDKIDLEWNAISKTSVESNCEFRIDLAGKYVKKDSDKIKNVIKTDNGFSIEDEGIIKCNGLFDIWVKNSNGKEKNIDILTDPITIRYGGYWLGESYIKQ